LYRRTIEYWARLVWLTQRLLERVRYTEEYNAHTLARGSYLFQK
jgi:hypothetical protein